MSSHFPHWIAFEHHHLLARGEPAGVIAAVQRRLGELPEALPIVLDAVTSERIELDWRTPAAQLLTQLPAALASDDSDEAPGSDTPRGPGRPKLGVTAREVTLLPRHWDWLARQPGGASVALRKLVQSAMREGGAAETQRRATEAAYRFMSVVGGDLPHYEELSRALFAGDLARVGALATEWPTDVSEHLLSLTARIDADRSGN